MLRRLILPFVILAMTGLAACGDGSNDTGDTTGDTTGVDFTELDRTWDSDDSLFSADYDSARATYTRMSAAEISDSVARARVEAHNRTLSDIETRRAAARRKREDARAANDRAAYDAARAEADYVTWRADLQRIRTEQAEMEGMINIGTRSVGGVDVNTGSREEPLIRVEPGKEDDNPLIEKNKNP